MSNKKLGFKITGKSVLLIGIAILVLVIMAFMVKSYSNNNQAEPISTATIRFEGEYKIGDGEWQPIVQGKHIPSTKGDVLLRGYFAYYNPDDGSYVDKNYNETPIAMHLHHIYCKIVTSEGYEWEFETENELIGPSTCGKMCVPYYFYGGKDAEVNVIFKNPHKFGNRMAIDEWLDSLAIYNGTDYEKIALRSGEFERLTGFVFIIASFLLLCIALFTKLLKIRNAKEMLLVGLLMLFAGVHYVFSSKSVYFWNQLITFNTIALFLSAILFMLFAVITIYTQLSSKVKKPCAVGVAISLIGAIVSVFVPLVSNVLFYDMWPVFLVAQLISVLIVMTCLLMDARGSSLVKSLIKISAILFFLSFIVDVVLNLLGILDGASVTKASVIVVFAVALVLVLRVIPQNINAAIHAKELESEQQALKLELQRSRVSLMLSQIRPHFIYNTLGTIGEFCEEKPQKAKQLVQEFSLYLRGNFGEIDNMNPIPVMQEMEHVKHYVKIENVRFPDMVMTFDLQAKDFFIPALSVQPLVENAIKHGLLKLEEGGVVTVKSYETEDAYCISVVDNGVGFDTTEEIDERKHIGIRNIRDRLRIMCGGTLTITSEVGVGTTAIITIPKEDEK